MMRLFLNEFLSLDSPSVSPTRDFRKAHTICTTFLRSLLLLLPPVRNHAAKVVKQRFLKFRSASDNPRQWLTMGFLRRFRAARALLLDKKRPFGKVWISSCNRDCSGVDAAKGQTLNHAVTASRYRYCPKTISTNSL